MLGARRAVERHVQPEAPKARGANQHEVRRFTVSRLGEVAQTLLHEVAAGQLREIHESILQGDEPSAPAVANRPARRDVGHQLLVLHDEGAADEHVADAF